jgi:hypothetical protein
VRAVRLVVILPADIEPEILKRDFFGGDFPRHMSANAFPLLIYCVTSIPHLELIRLKKKALDKKELRKQTGILNLFCKWIEFENCRWKYFFY